MTLFETDFGGKPNGGKLPCSRPRKFHFETLWFSSKIADAMWAAAIVEALDPDPFVRTRLVGDHASVGRLVALIMLTHVSRLLQRRELPGSILGSSVFFI